MLAFLNPRVWLALVFVGLGAFLGGFWKGMQYADRKAEIAALEQGIHARDAVIAEHQRQAQEAKEIADIYAQRLATAEQAAVENREEIERYAADLASRPTAPECGFTDDDVRLLRSLAAPRARRGAPLPPVRSN